MNYINWNNLQEILSNKKVKLIDIRAVEFYNGWPDKNFLRGHIPGAKSFPYKWFSNSNWEELIAKKDINKKDPLVIYGDDENSTLLIANHLITSGYNLKGIFGDFIDENFISLNIKLDKLPGYQKLVYPQWISELIEGKFKDTIKDYLIIHCHFQNPEDYRAGHIPGAISLDDFILENSDTWNKKSDKELKVELEKLGITSKTTVILYGQASFTSKDSTPKEITGGQLCAFRVAFILLYAGVEDVRILNGGFASWRDSGYKIEHKINLPIPIKNFGRDIPGRPEFNTNIDEVHSCITKKDKNIICVRTWKEFTGEITGYSYMTQKGRIPGSLFGNCGSDAYHMEKYRNHDNTTREYHEIETLWKESGIDKNRGNIFYCGTGWRASEAFFNALLMGWDNISLYDGGWYEWSGIPENVVVSDFETVKN